MRRIFPSMHPLALLLFIFGSVHASEYPGVAFVDLAALEGEYEHVVDTRAMEACRKATLRRARCLPVEAVMAPNRRLANFSGVLWMLGTIGLNGDGHVLVIGDDADRRDFIAGLLYLAGQQRISVLNVRISGRKIFSKGRGTPSSKIREQVYRAAMRDRKLILRGELHKLIFRGEPPVLLDGRTEEEYWGVRINAARGGHLPGARHLDSRTLKRLIPDDVVIPGSRVVAYGADAFTGLAYLARLAALGVEAQLYLEGWSGWASDGSLPVDSLSFSQHERS